MIDYVVCDYPLPIPDELEGKIPSVEDWAKEQFLTSSFQDVLIMTASANTYTIESDGQLYKNETELDYVEDQNGALKIEERSKGILKMEYTGEIHFYNMFTEDDHDYILEFIALFWKGDLKELSVKNWSQEDNAERKETQQRIKDAALKSLKGQSRFNHPIFSVYKKCVSFICGCIRAFFMLFVKLFWKIEQWLL